METCIPNALDYGNTARPVKRICREFNDMKESNLSFLTVERLGIQNNSGIDALCPRAAAEIAPADGRQREDNTLINVTVL